MANQRALIRMTPDEVWAFVERSRTATLATNGPTGVPHLVAMWYGIGDRRLYFETKRKAQKAVNLRRDPRVACLIEAGSTYEELRGVSIEGTATLLGEDDDEFWTAGISVYERYHGPYSEAARPELERMLFNRVVIRVDPVRVRSWDHRKLGPQPAPGITP